MKRLYIVRIFTGIFAVFCCFFLFAQQKQATFDLSEKLKNKEIVSLQSEWDFFEGKLLSPSDLRQDTTIAYVMTSARSWSEMKINGRLVSSKGCATYRLLLLNAPHKSLTLDVYSIQSAYRVFVNGVLRAEVGSPGVNKETTVPMNRDVQIELPMGNDTTELIVQVANFHHRKGGFVHPPEIGYSQVLHKQRTMYIVLDVMESAALAIIGLFLFALFVFRRKDLSVLYFALFCITLSFRPVIAVNYSLAYFFENINWELMLKMEYLAVVLPCLFMVLFIEKLFEKQLPGWLAKIFIFILLPMVFVVLFFPPSVFSWLVFVIQGIIPIGAIVFTVTIVRAIWAKVEGARYAGVGLITLLCSLILKVLAYAEIIPQVHVLITLLDIAFIFMMSLILGSRFSIQFSKVERLQRKTEAQHEEIQKQKMEVERQKDILEEKNKAIIDSINYAKRIQQTLMTNQRYIEKALKNLKKK